MRFPYSLKGMLFAPALISLIFVLKAFCPASAGNACFADWFATPVFLPLIAIYKIFGEVPAGSNGKELLFIILYWALTGFVIGLILDLYSRRSQYSLEQRPPL